MRKIAASLVVSAITADDLHAAGPEQKYPPTLVAE